MSNDNLPVGLTTPAVFDEVTFTYDMILQWALASFGGHLPDQSAKPFAEWLNTNWNQYDDGTGKLTNDNVLRGALAFWKGDD